MKRQCTCCGRTLNPATIVSLELDRRINEYHDFGGIPDEHNQGGFDFGPHCAVAQREKARRALNRPRLVNLCRFGPLNAIVRFSSWNKVYEARVHRDVVSSIHRVTQQAGGHAVGGSIDKWTSISKKRSEWDSLAAVALQLVEDGHDGRFA